MNDKISVIIPCYNVQNYIEHCLNSIINQTYENLEIICINDGSTDNTIDILENYQKNNDIIIINQENKGISEARNIGIQNASGVYILFVDSDDWLDVDCIEKISLRKKNYDVVCFSYFRDFKNISIPRKLNLEGEVSASFLQRKIIGPVDQELKEIENLDSLVTVWGKLYKAEKIKNVYFQDVKTIGTWEDGLFNVEMLENCDKILIVDQPLYHYRKDNQQSFTSKAKEGLYQKWLYKFDLIKKLITAKDKIFFDALENRIAISILGLALTEVESRKNAFQKISNLEKILSLPVYTKAIEQLKIDDFPMQWKLFYGLAKRKSAVGIYLLARTIQIIQRIKNL
ncbi:MAG: glycosyl transferase family 2 [Chryseobacterium sp.]|nr:MAG: glycosyl transferase family 2 [Chryseobacterium sp.]